MTISNKLALRKLLMLGVGFLFLPNAANAQNVRCSDLRMNYFVETIDIADSWNSAYGIYVPGDPFFPDAYSFAYNHVELTECYYWINTPAFNLQRKGCMISAPDGFADANNPAYVERWGCKRPKLMPDKEITPKKNPKLVARPL